MGSPNPRKPGSSRPDPGSVEASDVITIRILTTHDLFRSIEIIPRSISLIADGRCRRYDAGMSTRPQTADERAAPRLLLALALMLLAGMAASSCVQTLCSSQALATNFVSASTWASLTGARGVAPPGASGLGSWPETTRVFFSSACGFVFGLMIVIGFIGAVFIHHRGVAWRSAFATAGLATAAWWAVLAAWEWGWVAASASGAEGLASLLALTPQLWVAVCLSGWVSSLIVLTGGPDREVPTSRAVCVLCLVWALMMITLNWRLYFNLLIPHGDSVMYEEHLWNVLHGKGFRSYLDQGLFLGEHIQFIHLFLIPLYWFWPSHLLLEALESMALALGAFPVFWMVRRHTGSAATGVAAAAAYLLYAPMQFLDIEIDLKTFRPEAFGIPLLLLTLDQLDRGRLIGLLLGLAVTLSVKEDYSLVYFPLGLWIALRAGRPTSAESGTLTPRFWRAMGLGLSAFSVAYLWLATRVIMPWFRSGAEIHYAGYFRKFGESPEQIVTTMITQPGLLLGEFASTTTALYALALLAPLAFLPLLSPGRLAVGLPLFGILCLNELARDPRHHFHAPLVPILFWALAGALPVFGRVAGRLIERRGITARQTAQFARHIVWTSSLATGVSLTLTPLGAAFWDPGSPMWWKALYAPSRRAALFAAVPPQVPMSSRVASTDFVHPRFTHHDRSYDYSGYRRRVSNYEQRVPDDTEYIVIDTRHRYSTIKSADQIPEYRDHPEDWELLPDVTEGYFVILKRRTMSAARPQSAP